MKHIVTHAQKVCLGRAMFLKVGIDGSHLKCNTALRIWKTQSSFTGLRKPPKTLVMIQALFRMYIWKTRAEGTLFWTGHGKESTAPILKDVFMCWKSLLDITRVFKIATPNPQAAKIWRRLMQTGLSPDNAPELSVLGGFQDPTGWSPGQLSLTSSWPCCEQEIVSETSWAPVQPELLSDSVILWLHGRPEHVTGHLTILQYAQ